MATWAIGDVQGCFGTLERLLSRIRFDPASDRLWLVGDLVNRGPRSLEVLRWARGLGGVLTAVLGNHDLHLLARGLGSAPPRKDDTLEEVLSAPDSGELLAWLRERPFVYRESGYLLVHAGLLPAWTPEDAEALGAEAEKGLRSSSAGVFLRAVFRRPSGALPPEAARAARVFTSLRAVTADGQPLEGFSGAPRAVPAGSRPWYDIPSRRSSTETVVFGHWAALGFLRAPGLYGLDTGCVWGGSLTAVRLEDGEVMVEKSVERPAR